MKDTGPIDTWTSAKLDQQVENFLIRNVTEFLEEEVWVDKINKYAGYYSSEYCIRRNIRELRTGTLHHVNLITV